MNNKPIGILDSGMGGLSVWARIRAAMPGESLLYYADAAHCPYGDRSHDEIRGYVESAVEQMLERGVKMVVLACNTATGAAVKHLREKYPDIPFVGMEPAVKPAALGTKSGVVGVLATRSSLDSDHFRRTSAEFAARVEILSAVGEGWVGIVESGREDSSEALEAVRKVVEPMLEKGVDQIALGCSHYPFLAGTIRNVIGDRDVQLIDSAPAIVRRVGELLAQYGIAAAPDAAARYEFMASAGDDYMARLREKAESAANMIFR
jgi:glutamate racemase